VEINPSLKSRKMTIGRFCRWSGMRVEHSRPLRKHSQFMTRRSSETFFSRIWMVTIRGTPREKHFEEVERQTSGSRITTGPLLSQSA